METLVALIKTFPGWLATVAEVLLVAVIFMTAISFLWGFYIGVSMIRKRSHKLATVEFWPPKLTFHDNN
jgi:hypothetical protein